MPKLPAPFKRPSIDLGGGPSKEWRVIDANDLEVGDILKGYGRVNKIDTNSWQLSVQAGEDNLLFFECDDTVEAFTRSTK